MAELVTMSGLQVRRLPPEPMHVLHCDPADADEIGTLLGLDLPMQMLTVAERRGVRALHLAPDEWLLIGWVPPLASPVPIAHALVDVGSRSLTLEISGPLSEALINTGCALDLSARSFAPGRCTRTLFGKAQIVLERRQDCFRMQYARSFDGYVTELFATAATDLPAPVPG